MTLEDAQRLVDEAPCRRCGQPKRAGSHEPYRGGLACKFKLDRDALARAIVRATSAERFAERSGARP